MNRKRNIRNRTLPAIGLLVLITLAFAAVSWQEAANASDAVTGPSPTPAASLSPIPTPSPTCIGVTRNWSHFSNTEPIVPADRVSNEPGSEPGLPMNYPSIINVSGVDAPNTCIIGGLAIDFALTSERPDDLDILVVDPQGRKSLVISDAGGTGQLMWNGYLFGLGGSVFPDESAPPVGYYAGANYPGLPGTEPEGIDNFPSAGGSAQYTVNLNNLLTAGWYNPGDWKMYVVDDETGSLSSLPQGWRISFYTMCSQPGGCVVIPTPTPSPTPTPTPTPTITPTQPWVASSLYTFSTASGTGTNEDGRGPLGGLSRSGNVVFGTMTEGGAHGRGTVYRANIDGSGLTTLHHFTSNANPGPTPPANSNADGAYPQAGVIVSGNTLYGTARSGGAVGFGTVFKLNTDGSGFTVLCSFTGNPTGGNGHAPQGPLLLSGDTLYGTTGSTVFRVNTDGTGFAVLREFGTNQNPSTLGGDPSRSGLVLIGNTLYGTTSAGGANGTGTVFAINTDGSGFRIVHHFDERNIQTAANNDGDNPQGGLILIGNTLFGTASGGGANTRGTVWAVDTDGNNFRVLHTFSPLVNFGNPDGASPYAGLTLWNDRLFGTTTIGGAIGAGTIFSIKPDGTEFTVIYNYKESLGGGSQSRLLDDGHRLVGTLSTHPSGRIFSIFPFRTPFDYDADGRTDFSVFRPSAGAWYLQKSTAGFQGLQFGADGDRLTPADYDGDGKTDIAVYRPSSGTWYILKSSTGTVDYPVFGAAEDLPAPGDFDGDGKADLAVFRPSQGVWYRVNSGNGSFFAFPFGQNGDVPTVGDFDGDGKNDYGIFRPSNGDWYHVRSSDTGLFGERFGQTGDKIAPADYDGDGKTDIAIYRPSTGLWVIRNSSTSTYSYLVFGAAADVPVSGDYDGDGKADIAVWRPSDGTWYVQRSSNGQFIVFPWGQDGDRPTPGAYGN